MQINNINRTISKQQLNDPSKNLLWQFCEMRSHSIICYLDICMKNWTLQTCNLRVCIEIFEKYIMRILMNEFNEILEHISVRPNFCAVCDVMVNCKTDCMIKGWSTSAEVTMSTRWSKAEWFYATTTTKKHTGAYEELRWNLNEKESFRK